MKLLTRLLVEVREDDLPENEKWNLFKKTIPLVIPGAKVRTDPTPTDDGKMSVTITIPARTVASWIGVWEEENTLKNWYDHFTTMWRYSGNSLERGPGPAIPMDRFIGTVWTDYCKDILDKSIPLLHRMIERFKFQVDDMSGNVEIIKPLELTNFTYTVILPNPK